MQSGPIDAATVRDGIRDVLARQQSHESRSLLGELFDWLRDVFDLDPSGVGSAVDGIFRILAVLFGVFVLLLIVGLVRAAVRRRGATSGDGVEADVDPHLRALRLRHAARAASAAGDLQLALRRLLAALLVGLGARGNLEFRDAWTNRELLRRGRPSPIVREWLEALVREMEAKEYGRVPTMPADVERLERLCDEHLGPLGPPPAGAAPEERAA